MASIFMKIVKGEIPCYRIAEDDNYLAFLDINPLKKGHTLVVPKKEVDYLFDLDDRLLSGMMVFSKKVAVAIREAVDCRRIGVAVLGFDVPHAHIHLVPMDSMEDINFRNPKLKLSPEEFKEIAGMISSRVKL
jgi:histidine triad (HIT) family protein